MKATIYQKQPKQKTYHDYEKEKLALVEKIGELSPAERDQVFRELARRMGV